MMCNHLKYMCSFQKSAVQFKKYMCNHFKQNIFGKPSKINCHKDKHLSRHPRTGREVPKKAKHTHRICLCNDGTRQRTLHAAVSLEALHKNQSAICVSVALRKNGGSRRSKSRCMLPDLVPSPPRLTRILIRFHEKPAESCEAMVRSPCSNSAMC